MEGPSSEQTEQILQREPLHGPVGAHHQLAWTMNFNQRQKCVQRRILSAHKERREPWWTQITIQRSNSKALLISGGRKFLEEKKGKKKPCCLYEMMSLKDEEGEKKQGLDFHRTVWSCICQPWQSRWDDEVLVSSHGGNGIVFCFFFLLFFL